MSDLIQRYLDGTLTPEELAELDALLRDPAAAERFASLSRLDADLSSHFREEARLPALPPLPPRRAWAARLALAACLLLLAGAGLVWWSLPPAPSMPLPPDWPRYLVVDVDETVVLPDGSSVELTAGTTATLWPRAVEMREGEGRFDVRPGEERFEVKTPAGRVTAVGTQFQVNVNWEETMNGKGWILAVAVMAGLVDVSYDGKNIRLGAGQREVFGQEERRPRADVTRGVLEAEGTETKLSLRTAERRGTPATEVEIGKDVKVIVDGKPGKLAGLPRGTRVAIEKNDKGVIVSVRAEGVIRAGVVSAVEKDSITIEQRGRDGATTATFPAAGAAVTVDGKPGKLEDVKAGDRVTLMMSVDGKSVVALTKGAGRERRPEGGDRPARPVRAEIEEIDAKAGTITLAGERKRVLKLAKDVKITVNDKPGKLEDFKKGDQVVLTLSGREPVEVQAIASAPTRRER